MGLLEQLLLSIRQGGAQALVQAFPVLGLAGTAAISNYLALGALFHTFRRSKAVATIQRGRRGRRQQGGCQGACHKGRHVAATGGSIVGHSLGVRRRIVSMAVDAAHCDIVICLPSYRRGGG